MVIKRWWFFGSQENTVVVDARTSIQLQAQRSHEKKILGFFFHVTSEPEYICKKMYRTGTS